MYRNKRQGIPKLRSRQGFNQKIPCLDIPRRIKKSNSGNFSKRGGEISRNSPGRDTHIVTRIRKAQDELLSKDSRNSKKDLYLLLKRIFEKNCRKPTTKSELNAITLPAIKLPCKVRKDCTTKYLSQRSLKHSCSLERYEEILEGKEELKDMVKSYPKERLKVILLRKKQEMTINYMSVHNPSKVHLYQNVSKKSPPRPHCVANRERLFTDFGGISAERVNILRKVRKAKSSAL